MCFILKPTRAHKQTLKHIVYTIQYTVYANDIFTSSDWPIAIEHDSVNPRIEKRELSSQPLRAYKISKTAENESIANATSSSDIVRNSYDLSQSTLTISNPKLEPVSIQPEAELPQVVSQKSGRKVIVRTHYSDKEMVTSIAYRKRHPPAMKPGKPIQPPRLRKKAPSKPVTAPPLYDKLRGNSVNNINDKQRKCKMLGISVCDTYGCEDSNLMNFGLFLASPPAQDQGHSIVKPLFF